MLVEEKVKNEEAPPTAEASKPVGLFEDWFAAIRTGGKTLCDVELGRSRGGFMHPWQRSLHSRPEIAMDPVERKILDDDEADRLVNRPQRYPYHI